MLFAYRRRSGITRGTAGLAIALSPNLRRDRVSFDGTLKSPLRFREAISALHDVVINDLRYQPRDKTSYETYKTAEATRQSAIRQQAFQSSLAELKAAQSDPMPAGLSDDFSRRLKQYWRARQKYSNHLLLYDRTLWRLLMPCDPVITVAPDSLLFECFSADESSYGCLSVDRDAFVSEQNIALGTTNVDYSWSLYEQFQQLRSYRETRFTLDPAGFDVQTTDSEGHYEEKIDLPNSWLRGFMQLQSAMSLPMRRVPISREGIYNVLAFLQRHRAAKSPRAVRFELEPGKPVVIVLEPWEKRIELHSTTYDGRKTETIRIWGRDRLRTLARLLPLIESAEVHLLGTGLPSFWVARMGELRFTLGLSGWTTNDWTAASALSQLAPPAQLTDVMLSDIAGAFQTDPARSFEQVCNHANLQAPQVAAGLNRLALLGQLIHDLPQRVYRWRQVMPTPLIESQVGVDDEETIQGAALLTRAKFEVSRDEVTPTGMRIIVGKISQRLTSDKQVELLIDSEGNIARGKCKCSHHFANGLRKGPCRHLQAFRNHLLDSPTNSSLDQWYRSFWN